MNINDRKKNFATAHIECYVVDVASQSNKYVTAEHIPKNVG